MAVPAKQWGVTGSISLAMPTESDMAANSALLEELKRQNNFETPEENQKRLGSFLCHCRRLLIDWI